MSAAAYYLGLYPEIQAKLAQEVRSTFNSEDDITITSVQHLTYMLAVFEETMRMYPPVVSGLPRVIAEGGATIAGEYIPEDVRLSFPCFPCYRLARTKRSDLSIRPLLKFGSGLYSTTRITGRSPMILFPNAGSVIPSSQTTGESHSSHSLQALVTVLARSKL